MKKCKISRVLALMVALIILSCFSLNVFALYDSNDEFKNLLSQYRIDKLIKDFDPENYPVKFESLTLRNQDLYVSIASTQMGLDLYGDYLVKSSKIDTSKLSSQDRQELLEAQLELIQLTPFVPFLEYANLKSLGEEHLFYYFMYQAYDYFDKSKFRKDSFKSALLSGLDVCERELCNQQPFTNRVSDIKYNYPNEYQKMSDNLYEFVKSGIVKYIDPDFDKSK